MAGSSVVGGALVNGVVHVHTRLPELTTLPIGWIAVGDPARMFPPSSHDDVWAVQQELDFPKTFYGVERPEDGSSMMHEITGRYSEIFGQYMADVILGNDQHGDQ